MEHQREKHEKHRFKRRADWNDEHHLNTREGIKSNLLLIDAYRHDAWHLLLENQTLKEIIITLKKHRNIKHFLMSVNKLYKHNAFYLLFDNKTLVVVIMILERMQCLKDAQRIRLKIAA